jgi:hypothetical protein
MPSTSKKQHNFMAAAAHNPAFAKKVGIDVGVAKEFNKADTGTRADLQKVAKPKTDHGKSKLFKEGGAMAKMHSEKGEMKEDVSQDKKLIKRAFGMHDKQLHESKKTNLTKLKGGGMAKETMGPRTMAKDVEAGSNKLTKFGESAVQKRGHTKGKNFGDSGPSVGIQKMKKGGKVKRYDEGGFATAEGENKMIDDDVRSRAMAALEKGISDDIAAPAKKSAPSFKAKADKAGFTSAETKGGAALMTRKDRSTSTAATPKRAVKKSSASDVDYSVGNAMKKGGVTRGDGIASRGKTRGKIC